MRKEKQCVFHVGMHKTGTTSFQEMLIQNRLALSERGWAFLEHPTYGANSSWISLAMSGTVADLSVLDYFIENNKDRNLIISGEELSRLNARYFQYLTEKLESFGYTVNIVCVIREPVDYLSSSIPQLVADRRIDFPSLLDGDHILPDYDNIINLKVIYGNRFKIYEYKFGVSDRLFSDLFEFAPKLQIFSNVSITKKAVKFLAISGSFLNDHQRHEFISMFKTIPFGAERFMVPKEVLERFLPGIRNSYEKINLLNSNETSSVHQLTGIQSIPLSYYTTLDAAFLTEIILYLCEVMKKMNHGAALLFEKGLATAIAKNSIDHNFIGYIAANPDLCLTDVDPMAHYHDHGQDEGRLVSNLGIEVLQSLKEIFSDRIK